MDSANSGGSENFPRISALRAFIRATAHRLDNGMASAPLGAVDVAPYRFHEAKFFPDPVTS